LFAAVRQQSDREVIMKHERGNGMRTLTYQEAIKALKETADYDGHWSMEEFIEEIINADSVEIHDGDVFVYSNGLDYDGHWLSDARLEHVLRVMYERGMLGRDWIIGQDEHGDMTIDERCESYKVERYDTANGDIAWTVARKDKHGEVFDLNVNGEPVTTLDEALDFIAELHNEGAYDAETALILAQEAQWIERYKVTS